MNSTETSRASDQQPDDDEPFGVVIGILNVLGFWAALGVLAYLAYRIVS